MQDWLNEINKALALCQAGEPDEALNMLGGLMAQHEGDAFCRAIILDAEGKIFFLLQKPEVALAAFNQSLSLAKRLYAGKLMDLRTLRSIMQNYARGLLLAGRGPEAVRAAQEILELSKKSQL